MVAAGLKTDIRSCRARKLAGAGQCHSLGVWSAGSLVPTFGDYHIVLDQNTANPWVGMNGVLPATRQANGLRHMPEMRRHQPAILARDRRHLQLLTSALETVGKQPSTSR
jgi:hypothetical protein